MSQPTGTEEQIRADRIAKVESVRAAGGEPYPVTFDARSAIADVRARFESLEPGTETGEHVRVAGRVMGRRGHGKAMFLDLVDAGAGIQLHATLDATERYEQ